MRQKAMEDFTARCRTGKAPDHPAAYVQRAANRFFIKKRQRERERVPRELRGGHLVIEEHRNEVWKSGEEKQFIELCSNM